eukprot:131796_1
MSDRFNPITLKLLQEIHDNQLENGENNDERALNIVNILGGIDSILTTYLGNNMITTQSKMEQLHQIITIQNPFTPKPQNLVSIPSNQRASNNENIVMFHDDLNLLFAMDENDNLFPAQYSQRLMSIVHSRLNLILFVIIFLIDQLILSDTLVVPLIVELFIDMIIITECILFLFSINRKACKMTVKTFEFWLKMTWIINSAGLELYIDSSPEITDWSDQLINVLGMACFAMFDGVHISNRLFPAVGSVLVGLSYMYWSIRYQFFDSIEEDKSIYIAEGISFSAINALASIWRILGIFIAKQSVNIILHPKHATFIYVKPELKWQHTNATNMAVSFLASSTDIQADNPTTVAVAMEMNDKKEIDMKQVMHDTNEASMSAASLDIDDSQSNST